MSVTIDTKDWDFAQIHLHLDGAMDWIRKNSEDYDSPRRLSLAIRGLLAGGDPKKAHHIQRLVTKLRKLQYLKDNAKKGSWNGEIADTANALIALRSAIHDPETYSRKIPFLKNGLEHLEITFDKKSNNWLDYFTVTIVSCNAILVLNDHIAQKEHLEKALDWLCSRYIPSEKCFVSAKHTAQLVQLLTLAKSTLETTRYDDSINHGLEYLITSGTNNEWSDDTWTISESLLAIIKSDRFAKGRYPIIKTYVDLLLNKQDNKNAWDNSITKTTNAVMVLSEILGWREIEKRRLRFWTSFSPTSALFTWDRVSRGSTRDDEIFAIGKIHKIQSVMSPTILEEYQAEISPDAFAAFTKLDQVTNAADMVRKRGTPSASRDVLVDISSDYVSSKAKDVGDDIYTNLLQHGENQRKFEEELAKNKVDHITITPDDTMSHIPWELTHDGHDFCCLKYSVGRLLKGARNDQKIENTHEKIRVLLVGDFNGDLIEANKEIEIIKNHFDNDKFKVDYFTPDTYDIRDGSFRTKFLSSLRNGKYDIIHYSGHADFDSTKGKSYLYFRKPRDGYADRVSALEVTDNIQMSGHIPKIIFFNACSSAAKDIDDKHKILFDDQFVNLAKNFVKGFSDLTVPAYVGAIWPIHDKEAADFAINFYESIELGCTVGDAIRLARKESFSNYPNTLTWASFILYGDPARKLIFTEARDD